MATASAGVTAEANGSAATALQGAKEAEPVSRQFPIYESDLAELESTVPQLADALMPVLTNKLRVQLRRVQKILSDVRWQYGPPCDVEVIPADQEGKT